MTQKNHNKPQPTGHNNTPALPPLTAAHPTPDQPHKPHKPKTYEGYCLDQVVTFRKKHTDNHPPQQDQPPYIRQQPNYDKSQPIADLKIKEERAKTQLFEYADEAINNQLDPLLVQGAEGGRLPNLSAQLSAFKQEQNSFLKQLLGKKCKQTLLRRQYPSHKSISTQISCEKVWLKHKNSLAIHPRSCTEELQNVHLCEDKRQQLKSIVDMPQERLRLCRKAIVMSLSHKNQTQNSEQKTDSIHLNRYRKQQLQRYRKDSRMAATAQEQSDQHLLSLILATQPTETKEHTHHLRQPKRANSQNSISSPIKPIMRDKSVRIRSTHSDYLQSEKHRLLEGLSILNVNVNRQQSSQQPIQLHTRKEKDRQDKAKELQAKTKNKVLNIFRKIKEQRLQDRTNSQCLAQSLSCSMTINSKENQRLGCFSLNSQPTPQVETASGILRTEKQDVKISCRGIVGSLKIFADSKKSQQISKLFGQEGNRLNSGGVLLGGLSPPRQ